LALDSDEAVNPSSGRLHEVVIAPFTPSRRETSAP
jgi:hypothetical protein